MAPTCGRPAPVSCGPESPAGKGAVQPHPAGVAVSGADGGEPGMACLRFISILFGNEGSAVVIPPVAPGISRHLARCTFLARVVCRLPTDCWAGLGRGRIGLTWSLGARVGLSRGKIGPTWSLGVRAGLGRGRIGATWSLGVRAGLGGASTRHYTNRWSWSYTYSNICSPNRLIYSNRVRSRPENDMHRPWDFQRPSSSQQRA